MAKQSELNMRNGIILLLVGAIVVQLGGFYDFTQLSVGTGADGGDTTAPTGSVVQCSGGQTQSATISAIDIDNKGTALTEGTNMYQKEGTSGWTTWTQGTAITGLSVGEAYRFVAGISNTDFIDNAYGPILDVSALPCIFNEEVELYQDDDETGLTATFFNENDAASTAEAMSTGDTATVEARFSATNDEYFGNPYISEQADAMGVSGPQRSAYPNVLVLQLNSTEQDAPLSVKVDGVEMNKVSTPGRLGLTSGFQYYAYEAPVITDSDVTFDITLDADDSTDPVNDGTAHLFAANWYVHSNTGETMWGVETDEDAAAGTDAADTLTIDIS